MGKRLLELLMKQLGLMCPCRWKYRSRPFKHRDLGFHYTVCLECGKQHFYNWEGLGNPDGEKEKINATTLEGHRADATRPKEAAA